MRKQLFKRTLAGLMAAAMVMNTAVSSAYAAAPDNSSVQESQDAQRIENELNPETEQEPETKEQIRNKLLKAPPLKASQQIRTFNIQFVYGAENQGGKMVWTPKTPDKGHKFVYRVNYALSGIGENAVDTLHITIPKHILKNRNGSFADIADLALPSARQVADGEADNDIYLAWREEGNNIVIYNYKPISAADNGYVEISYETSEPTYYYKDMAKSDDFHATISVNGTTQNSTSIPVYMNTGAVINGIEKRYPTKYNEWQSWFGTKPSGADNYFYLVWDLETSISEDITQPYNLKYVDSATSSTGGVEVVGFKYAGTSGFTANNTITNQIIRGKRYDKVLTRYSKSQFNAVNEYTITNNIRAELTPVDGLDPMTKASSQRVFNYSKNRFFPPSGWFWSEKAGDGVWRWYYDNENREYNPFYYLGMKASEYSSYDLDQLKDKKISYIPGLDFAVWSHGYQYWYTVSGNHNNPDDYGKVKVRHEITDDNVHFVNESRKLTSADFQIDTLVYEIVLQSAQLNGETGKFEGIDVSPNNTDIVRTYAKFGSSSTWNLIATQNLGTGQIDVNSTYVSGSEKYGDMRTKLTLKDNCVGYRISIETPYYYTRINSVPNMRLKNSSYVMNYVASRDDAQIVNEASSDFYNNSGTNVYHQGIVDSDFVRIIERNSYLSKRITTATNVAKKRQYHIGWKIEQDENYTVGAGERKNIPQKGGIFYDLLPKGSRVNISSIAVQTPEGYLPENAYTYTLAVNYRNSGRTLLKVKVNNTAEKYTLYYETIHSWDSLKDYGNNIYNPVAYETGNEDIADGFPDNGGNIRDKTLFNDLDTATSAPKFIYAEEEYDIVAITAAAAGLTKKIKNAADQDWSYETTTTTNGAYQYRLRYANSNTTKAKDLILFDSLENYVTPNGDVSDFHGTPVGLDLAQIIGRGVNPVVYISTIPNLDLESHHDLADSAIWTRLNSITRASLAPAKAIAIDMRKTASGANFVLPEGDVLTAILYMQAPATAESGGTSSYPWAYNNIYIEDTVVDKQGGEDHFFIHHDYTAVKFTVTASFALHKTNKEDKNESVPGIKYRVFGRSDYNTDVDIIKETSNFGVISFANIEKGTYTLSEYESTPDWQMDYTQHTLQVTATGKLLVDGVDCTNLTWETVDRPRIHGDVSLIKRREGKEDGIDNTWFQLSGISDYGNDILMNNQVDTVGRLIFENVEMGTYSLTETRANDQYIKNKTKWTVRIDEHGTASLLEPENTADRDRLYQIGRMDDYYIIYNEPRYWNVSIRKIDADTINRPSTSQIWLQGAKFTLSGVSDLGNNYNATVTSNADGLVEFTHIEKGTYLLKEIEAPHNVDEYGKTGTGGTRNYLLDSRDYVLKVDAQGNATVAGLSKNELGNIKFPNSRALDKKITITKKWIDANPANRPTPVLHLSTMEPVHGRNILRFNANGGTFTGDKTTNDLIYSDPLIRLNSQKQEVKEQVLISGAYQAPTRKSYAFTGWYAESSCKTLVSTTGTNIQVSGIKNLYAGWRELTATFLPGEDFNKKLRTSTFSNTTDFKKYTGGSFNASGKTIVSTSNSGLPIYIWKDGTIIYWYSEANKVYANANAQLMFAGGFGFGTDVKNIDVTGIRTDNTTNMKSMFKNVKAKSIKGLNGFNTSKVTDMSQMFFGSHLTSLDLHTFNTSNVTNMSEMFRWSDALTSINFSGWNTGKVTDMSYMFGSCSALNNINVSHFNTSNVTTMEYMFDGCSALTTLDLSKWNTGKVTNMLYMFGFCNNLTSLNVTNFNTSNVTNMNGMFFHCEKLTKLDLSKWNTGKVTILATMFQDCTSLTTLNVSKWNTANATNTNQMFYNCRKLTTLDLSGWNTGKVIYMSTMFCDCVNLTNIYVSNRWNTSRVTDSTRMFSGCTKLPNFNPNITNKTKAHYNAGGYLKYKAYVAVQPQNAIDEAFAVMQMAYDKANEVNDLMRGGVDTASGKVLAAADAVKSGFAPMVSYAAEYHPVANTANALRNPVNNSRIRLNAQQNINLGNGNYEYISDGALWVKNGDTWTYTFNVFDDQVKYFLTEETVAGYTADATSWTIDGRSGQKEATITNKVATGNLSVQKKVVGTTTTDKFTFNITLEGVTGDRVYGGVLFTDGQATISLGNDETKTINGIPNGVSYTVTEVPDERFNISYSNATGQITANTTKAAVVTNTYIPSVTPPADAPVDITLKKEVAGHFESGGTYEITAWFEGLEKNKEYTYGSAANEKFKAQEDGTAVFKLSIGNGETKLFKSIPVGAKYQFTEAAGNYVSAYSVTNSQEEGSIVNSNAKNDTENTALATALETADANEAITVTFKNTVNKMQPLHIRKVVASNSDADHSAHYPISIRLMNLEPNGKYDTSVGRLVADGDGVIEKDASICEADGIDFYGLPVGSTYQITEGASKLIASYAITVEGTANVVAASTANTDREQSLSTAVETVNENENATVTFTNVKLSNLTLKKLTSNNTTEKFNFTIELGGTGVPATVKIVKGVPNADEGGDPYTLTEETVTLTNNKVTIQLGKNEYYTIKNLPLGVTYKIVEPMHTKYRQYIDNAGVAVVEPAGTSHGEVAATGNMGEDREVVYTNKPRDAKLKLQKQVNNRHETYGDVVTRIKVSGNDYDNIYHEWIETIIWPASEVEITVPVGVYKVEELSSSRYYPINVEAIAGDVETNQAKYNATVDLTEQNATVKFTNDFTQYEELSHTNGVVNIVPKKASSGN